MLYYKSNNYDPHYNLALEEYLFEKAGENDELFMLWRNRPAVIIGRNQNAAEEVNADYIAENSIDVVRRMTGGGAVYHDFGNINFTFISGTSKVEAFDFSMFLNPLIRVCSQMGIRAEFTGRNDVTINGKKISGNSQHIRNTKLLHHGCILLDADLYAAENALNVDADKFRSKSIKSVKSRITNINAEAKTPASIMQFMDMLKKEVESERRETLQTLTLSKCDLANIEHLKENKYNSWSWNYGSSPQYNKRVRRRFDAGSVTAEMLVDKGVLLSIKFYGDFFSEYDISEFENQLTGTRADDIARKIKEIYTEKYIRGVSGDELAVLLSSNS